MYRSLPLLLLLGCATLSVAAQSADAIQKRLVADADKLRAWGGDTVLLQALRAQNARKVTAADIEKQDQAWVAGKNDALVRAVTTGPCADRLRELAGKSGYGEAFLIDARGALVCATQKTSDYWQGDEAKWSRAFDGGKGATFIDRLRRDESANANLAQISIPVMDGSRAIGVITAGIPPK